MTNDELQKLAAGLAECGKALLRMADALVEKKEEAPAAEVHFHRRSPVVISL